MVLTRIAIAFVLISSAACDVTAADAVQAKASSRLVNLGRALEHDDALVQADFAAVALDAMVDAYERELETVASPKRRFSQRERSKQWRWAAAARTFLETVYQARQALDEGAPVELVAGSPVEVQILVGELLVPVTSPRIDEPTTLEDRVLEDFCYLHRCDESLLGEAEQDPPIERGGWSFRQGMGSTYVTLDGLAFMFSSLSDRALKEEICLRAAAELRMVVDVLKRADALGIDIDWDSMRIVDASTGAAERLIVGRGNAGQRVSAPILRRAPGVLQVARPWLRARMRDKSAEQLFPRADLLFGNVLALR